MKILLCSHCFDPSVGGIEMSSRALADGFTRAGASVTVVTNTPGEGSYPFPVVRRPGRKQLIALGKQADVIFQNNISLQTLLPLFLCRRPIVITTHTWISRSNNKPGWQDRLKLFLMTLTQAVVVSKPLGDSLYKKPIIIPNSVETELFAPYRSLPKSKDIVFVGRLVSDKGCDLALRALASLRDDGLTPSFTVIGDGRERNALEALTLELGLTDQVTFLGTLGESRGKEVAAHRIMVIPSRWLEPFGIVALEGIASGCVVVASSGGGLPEAVGRCGLLFPNGDALALAEALKKLLTDDRLYRQLAAEADDHLKNFTPERITQSYLDLFRGLVEKRA